SETEQQKRAEIEENIERKYQMIDRKQGRMIASLLEKPFKKIQINRLLVNYELQRELITNPKE
ncbi:24355_t:CDS:1, partial [Racocetra persica]